MLINYLDNEHYPRRHEWARPWTSQYRHYGNTATSRLEGTHDDAKTYIGKPSGDITQVVSRLENYIVNKMHNFETKLAMNLERIPGSVMAPACPIFTPLIVQRVSNAALKHVAK